MDDVKKQLSGLVFDFRPSLLEAVPPTSDFMACVKSLISELSKYNSSFESISESVQNAEDFSADVSSVLRELECPYDGIYSGPYEERFVETKDKVCLLTYLASEIQAEQICAKKKTEQSGNGVLDHAGKEGYQQMKALIRALKMQKPPKTITSQQLFSGIDKKIDSFLNGRLLPDVIGKEMITHKLSPMHFIRLKQLNTLLMKEYGNRREMLLTRLRVTLQSFIWAGRGKEKKDDVLSLSNKLLSNMSKKTMISVGQCLAARETILVSTKTSSGEARINTDINKHRMLGKIADRGGRVTEMAPMENETFAQQEAKRNMPKWSSRQAPPPGSDRRGGGRGGNRGGGHRGANRGGNRGAGSINYNDPRPQYDNNGVHISSGRQYCNSGAAHRGGFRKGNFSS